MRILPLLCVALAALLFGASASGGEERTRVTSAAETSLSITAWPQGRGQGKPSRRWTLRCGPVGGTLPNRISACRSLGSLAKAFAPVPPDTACTEIYGGPAEALVAGRHGDRRIWTRFRRNDGCHIDRWNRHRFLFPIRV